MKPGLWVPTVAFLATAIPVVALLNYFDIGGDLKVWIALACGVVATAYAQSRLARKEKPE